jgi:hypothetical protein
MRLLQICFFGILALSATGQAAVANTERGGQSGNIYTVFAEELPVDKIQAGDKNMTKEYVKSVFGQPEKEEENNLDYREKYGLTFNFSGYLNEIHIKPGFKGRFPNGITINSTTSDIFRILRRPKEIVKTEDLKKERTPDVLYRRQDGIGRIGYYGGHLIFWLNDDKIDQIVSDRICLINPATLKQRVNSGGQPKNSSATASDKRDISGKELELKIIAKNEVARKMIDTYKNLQSYQAVWEIKMPQDAEQGKQLEIKILFDRKTNNAVYQTISKNKLEDGTDENKLSILVIKNNNKLSVFSDIGLSQAPVIKETEKEDTNEITYRDIRRAIMMFYPADMAMIMSDVPLHEILQGIPESCLTEISDTNGITLKLLSSFETDAFIGIDPNTNLINEYCFFDKATGEKCPPIFKLITLKTNEPIDAGLFDFDMYLEKYGIKKEEKEPVKQ